MANWLTKHGGIASRPQIVHSGGGQPVEIGEGGEKEYVVPESKLKPFAQSVQSGRPANPATLPRMQGGGILDPDDPNNFLTPPFLPPGLVQPTGAQPVGPVQGPGPAPLGPPTGQTGPPPGVGEPPPLGTPGQPPPPPAPQVAAPNYRFDPDNPAAPVPQQRSLQQQAILGKQKPSVLGRVGSALEGLATGGIPGAVEGAVHPGRGEAAQQLALQNQQAAQQSNLATAEATREKTLADVGELGARAGYYKQQADTLAVEGKRAPKGNYITVKDGLFNADDGTWVVQPTKPSPDVLEIDPIKGQALGIKPTADGRYLIPKEGIGPYLTTQNKPAKEPTVQERELDARVRSIAIENRVPLDNSKPLLEQLPPHLQAQATVPAESPDTAATKALTRTATQLMIDERKQKLDELRQAQGPEAIQGYVNLVAQDPGAYFNLDPKIKPIVQQAIMRSGGQVPIQKPNTDLEKQAANGTLALSHVQNVQRLAQDPFIAQHVLGPAEGRIAKGEQLIGMNIPGATPEQTQMAQDFLSSLNYLFMREGRALFGGRPPQQLMEELKRTSPAAQMTGGRILGSLDAVRQSATMAVQANRDWMYGTANVPSFNPQTGATGPNQRTGGGNRGGGGAAPSNRKFAVNPQTQHRVYSDDGWKTTYDAQTNQRVQ